MTITFRPATDADKDFARRVYVATTKPYVDHLPDWTDDYIRARFERRFIVASTRMVERDGATVGWVRLTETPDKTVLEQIYVDPARHRQGIGAAVLTQLVREWHGKTVALRTLRRNPARLLYERFGFRVVDESDPNSLGMMRSAATLPPPHAVILRAYDPTWPAQAEAEARRLEAALGDNLLRVEHFGSTAVPGLEAKPVLDLMPIVVSLATLDGQRAALEGLGYLWHGEFELPGRRYCTLTDAAGLRRVHLHCYQDRAAEIARHLIFRDYLRADPDARRAYAEEKRRVASLHPADSQAYNMEKAAWVKRAEAQALAWHVATHP